MKLLIFPLFFLFCIANTALAQAPAVEWYRILGSYDGDYAYDIQSTTDGGYIVSGWSENSGGDVSEHFGNRIVEDLWVVKLDAGGTIEWERTLGNRYAQYGGYVRQMADGGYIVCGSTIAPDDHGNASNFSFDYWLVKLSPDGTIAWEKRYGGIKHEYLEGIELTADGGLILVGDSESKDGDIPRNQGDRDLCILKVDANGNKQWVKTYGGSGFDRGYSVAQASDGGYFVVGHTESRDGDVTGLRGNHDYWVLKLDRSGNLQWQKCMGGTQWDEAQSVLSTADGGCIVAGTAVSKDIDVSGSRNTGLYADMWVVKLDATGKIQWQKSYGGRYNDWARSIRRMPDGGYIIVGASESSDGDATCNAGLTDVWIVKINSTGTLGWQKSIGGVIYDEATSVQPHADGSITVAGYSCSKEITGWHEHNVWEGTCADYFIIKLGVPGAPPQNASVSISAQNAVCTGQPITLTANARYVGISPTYTWTRNGMVVPGNSATLKASDFAYNEVVTCTVTPGGPCNETFSGPATATYTFSLKQRKSPVVRITASQTQICATTSVTFTAQVEDGGTAPEFLWQVNGVTVNEKSSTFINAATKAGDVITCYYSDASICMDRPLVASNNITITGIAQPVTTVSISGPAGSICSGMEASFSATVVNGGSAPHFQWKINDLEVGTNSSIFNSATLADGDLVSCTVSPGQLAGCSVGNPVTSTPFKVSVTGKVTPAVTISASTTEICSGAEMTFTATAANAGSQPAYKWWVNNNPVSSNSATFRTTSLANDDVVSCTITADPDFSCALTSTAASNSIPVRVSTPVLPRISIAAENNDVCEGTPIRFRATADAAGNAPTYQWMVNGSPAGNQSNFESAALKNGDEVHCIIIPAQGVCPVTARQSNSIIAVVKSKPAVTITPADTIIAAGSQLQFRVTVSGSINGFTWSPAEKMQLPITLEAITIALEDGAEFALQVIGANGCTATAKTKVDVQRHLFLPNGFSPNGDGLNDVFRIPPGVALDLKQFSVYDRWGNLVFTTKNIREGWDGNFGGKPLPTGVYVYFIEGNGSKGAVRLKGTVLLVR